MLNEKQLQMYGQCIFLENYSSGYKTSKTLTTTSLAIRTEIRDTERLINQKFQEATSREDYERLKAFIEKRMRMVQRKINGKEISNKQVLQEYMTMLKRQLSRVNTRV